MLSTDRTTRAATAAAILGVGVGGLVWWHRRSRSKSSDVASSESPTSSTLIESSQSTPHHSADRLIASIGSVSWPIAFGSQFLTFGLSTWWTARANDSTLPFIVRRDAAALLERLVTACTVTSSSSPLNWLRSPLLVMRPLALWHVSTMLLDSGLRLAVRGGWHFASLFWFGSIVCTGLERWFVPNSMSSGAHGAVYAIEAATSVLDEGMSSRQSLVTEVEASADRDSFITIELAPEVKPPTMWSLALSALLRTGATCMQAYCAHSVAMAALEVRTELQNIRHAAHDEFAHIDNGVTYSEWRFASSSFLVAMLQNWAESPCYQAIAGTSLLGSLYGMWLVHRHRGGKRERKTKHQKRKQLTAVTAADIDD